MSIPLSRSPKLRTKKGCVTCRSRRKKCDEERTPNCAACDRLSLKCQWPDHTSPQDRRERGAVNSRWSQISKSPEVEISLSKIPPSTQSQSITEKVFVAPVALEVGTSSHGILSSAQNFLRSDREVVLMTYYCESFIPANILPKAHSNFSKVYAGDVEELKNSMFACSSVQLANKTGGPPIEALNYYTRAVSGLRRRLDTGSVTGLEDWLLAATILLHCFETWRCDANQSVPLAFQHLLGAIQLLKLRCATSLPDRQNDLDVLIAESIIFHVSTMLAFDSSLAALEVDSDMWVWIEVILQRPAYDTILAPINHPVLGTPRQLNKLVFEISRLSVRTPIAATDMPEHQRLSVELMKWEDQNCEVGSRELQEDPYIEVRQLYIICARIILLSIETTGKPTELLRLQLEADKQRSRGMAIIRGMGETNEEPWNFLMRWPLSVLGNTLNSESERGVIRKSLERLWANSSCGNVKRSLEKLQCLPIRKE